MPEATQSLICDEMSQTIINAVEEIAMEGGAATLTVRQILRKLDISNRVFYNRFQSLDELLEAIRHYSRRDRRFGGVKTEAK